jgi:hypothetical protein
MAVGPNVAVAGIAASAPDDSIPANSAAAIEALKSDMFMVYKAVIALEKRVNDYAVNMVEIKPQLIALKVHTESFPNALREIRRGQTSTQKAIADFESRLGKLEALLKPSGAGS